MDRPGQRFREVGRLPPGRAPAGSPLRLVGALVGSVLGGAFGVVILLGDGWFAVVLGVVLLLGAVLVAVGGVQRYRLARSYRRIPADGRGLSTVEGPVRWERHRNGPDELLVGTERFALALVGGPFTWSKLSRAMPAPAVARAWFLPPVGLEDALLVRLDARPRTDAELLGDVDDLERRFAAAAAAGEVRPGRHRRFLDALPTLRAAFRPGAPASARSAAAADLDRFRRRLPNPNH